MEKLCSLLITAIWLLVGVACTSEYPQNEFNSSTDNFLEMTSDSEMDQNESTRGPGLSEEVDDETLEIMEADFWGAIEGVKHAMDFLSRTSSINGEEAIGVIIVAALTYGAARSHTAYVNRFHNTEYGYCSVEDSESVQLISNQDIVRVVKSEQVANNEWAKSQYTDGLSNKYPNATYVAKMHNSTLAVLKNTNNMNEFDSYETSLSKLTTSQRNFFNSTIYTETFSNSISNPFDFSNLYSVTSSDACYKIIKACSKFLASAKNCSTLRQYRTLRETYSNQIEASTELNDVEKECVQIGLAVGEFSLNYWNSELPKASN